MDPATLQQVRSTPLFSGLTAAQLGCIEPGEVIEAPVGTVLATEGERSPYFFVVLEGEVRLTRTYDRQTVLMGVIKPGNFTGETTLLLDIPWLAMARVATQITNNPASDIAGTFPGSRWPGLQSRPDCSGSSRRISGGC